MISNQWKKIERYAYLGITICLIIIVIISSTSYQSLVHIQNDYKWVSSTREVLLNLSYFLSNLKDAEAGQHAFMLTGEEHYLEPYRYLEKGIKHHFASLRAIAAANAVQQKKLDIFEELANKKLADLHELILLQKDKGTQAAKDVLLNENGKKIMDEIHVMVLEMDKDERILMDQRAELITARVKLDAVVKTAGIILILVTAILIITRINYWFADYKRSEKKQIELVNMKSDFVSTISHELRTPLNAIRESIGIVLDGSAGTINEEQKKFLEVSKRNIDRLAKLINDVLDFQKLNSQKSNLSMVENDMYGVVNEVYELMACSAEKKGLHIDLQLDKRIPNFQFDKDKIIQVLTNLVNNAIKFTEKGNITIAANKNENTIFVSVEDTGCGIAQEDFPRLFNRFEQLNVSGHKKSVGTGLGLAISKEIIRQHKGKIWVNSEPGKGTTIGFILPLKERKTG